MIALRSYLAIAAALVLGWVALASPAHAQNGPEGNTTGLVVTSCGSPPHAFVAGNPGPFTVDTNGKLCADASAAVVSGTTPCTGCTVGDLLGVATGPVVVDSGIAASNVALLNGVSGQSINQFVYGSSGSPLPVNVGIGGYGAVIVNAFGVASGSATDGYGVALIGNMSFLAGSHGSAVGLAATGTLGGSWSPSDANSGAIGVSGNAVTSVGGAIFGGNFNCTSNTTTGTNITCVEVDVFATANVTNKWGVIVNDNANSTGSVTGTMTVKGSGCSGPADCVIPQDAAFSWQTVASAGSPYGWDYGILAVEQNTTNAQPPIRSTGSFIRTGGYTLTNLIDIPDLIVSGNLIKYANFNVTGAGALSATSASFSGNLATNDGSTAQLRMVSSSSLNFIESGNSAFNASVGLYITGANDGTAPLIQLQATSTVAAGTLTVSGIGATAQADVVCTTSAGLFTYQPSATGCVASSERFKNMLPSLTRDEVIHLALGLVQAKRWTYKDPDFGDSSEYIGFTAEQIEKIDARFITRDKLNLPYAVKHQQITETALVGFSLLLGDIKAANDNRDRRIAELETELATLKGAVNDNTACLESFKCRMIGKGN